MYIMFIVMNLLMEVRLALILTTIILKFDNVTLAFLIITGYSVIMY